MNNLQAQDDVFWASIEPIIKGVDAKFSHCGNASNFLGAVVALP